MIPMQISIQNIEEVTSKQLRQLPTHKTEENIYAEEGIYALEDNDSITAEESGFMLGYLNAY